MKKIFKININLINKNKNIIYLLLIIQKLIKIRFSKGDAEK